MVTRIIHKQVGNHTYIYERIEHDKYLGKCPEDCKEHQHLYIKPVKEN